MDVDAPSGRASPSPMEIDNEGTTSAEDTIGPSSDPSLPVPYSADIRSFRQACEQFAIKVSKNLDEKFDKKKSEWEAAHNKMMECKDLLELMKDCRNAKGELDLTRKDAKTLQLIEKLEQRRAAGDPPLPKRYSENEYNTLFNSVKNEQDKLSFNHNMMGEEMKELSQKRSMVFQQMLNFANADHQVCMKILQRIR